MCTVTFLPTENGYLITSNRDEWNRRPAAEFPKFQTVHNQEVLFPRDPQASGSWIALHDHFALCLLNGAFQKHQSSPPYRLSRGIMLLDFFKYLDPQEFADKYDFKGIENFTLLIKSNIHDDFYELRWDGHELFSNKLSAQEPAIWSSCTLYEPQVIAQRQSWFEDWKNQQVEFRRDQIVNFHRFAGDGDLNNDVIMRRDNGVETVSITSIEKEGHELSMNYIDLVSGINSNECLSLNLGS